MHASVKVRQSKRSVLEQYLVEVCFPSLNYLSAAQHSLMLLRINPKLGGINSILDPADRGADFLREPTIIFGTNYGFFSLVQFLFTL